MKIDNGERRNNLRRLSSFFAEYVFPLLSKADEKQYSYTMIILKVIQMCEKYQVSFCIAEAKIN